MIFIRKFALTILSFIPLLSAIPTFTSMVSAEKENDFKYLIKDGKAEVIGYSGSDESLIIPDTLGGASVTIIGKEAFSYDDNLKEIKLPDSVAKISSEAFSECSELKNVTILSNKAEMNWNVF